MKQLSPTSLYAVELPEGSKNAIKGGLYLPVDENWIILFTTATATEQDWAGVVPEMSVGNRWPNYCGDYPIWFHTRKESFHSLLAANGLEVGRNYAILEKVK
jgi:hypothetical protein